MERYEREKSLSIYWINRANDLRGAAGAVWFAIQNESKSDQIHNLLGMELAIDSPSLVLLDAVRALVGSGILSRHIFHIADNPEKSKCDATTSHKCRRRRRALTQAQLVASDL